MSPLVYAVDLGSTNIKVVLYDDTLAPLASASRPVRYDRDADRVEFDADEVVDAVIALIGDCARDAVAPADREAIIAVTGQAESLVLADRTGRATGPAISWMDERSHVEAAEIAAAFDPATAFAVTGEPAPIPTWPATKLRWLAKHHPGVLGAAAHVLMIKDYLLLRLTGRAVGEETTRGFTYLYDVPGRRYWDEMVAFCGVRPETLPELVPAGAVVGSVRDEVRALLPPAASYAVNAGALDHFCAMVGTGSYRPGAVSASAGTVLALSMLVDEPVPDPVLGASLHPGIRPGETVLFTCADSGGVCLSWFQEQIAGQDDYDALEQELPARDPASAPLFLPYLTGVNPPDFDPQARGAFVDLHLRHDRVDLAYAVMEGVAHLLRRNIVALAERGHAVDAVVSAGGGTASRFWNQLKADVTGVELRVPHEAEAACRGAALLALAAAGVVSSIDDTARLHRPDDERFPARHDTLRRARYDAFDSALTRLYGAGHPRDEERP